MHVIKDVAELEALVGRPPKVVLMKQIGQLDEGCRTLLRHSPLAGFGYRTATGHSHTTLVGGARGFAQVASPTRFSFALGEEQPTPERGAGASFVFLLPGVGETLRVNGKLLDYSAHQVTIAVEEAYIHCARAILRAHLWGPPRTRLAASAAVADEPLRAPAVAAFLAASPFALLSSRTTSGTSDTSPRGDDAGFLRVLDGTTLVLPDRSGNQRTDTFHNLMDSRQLSLVALVPGHDQLLHLRGEADVVTDEALLATMALNGKPPHAALRLHVTYAQLTQSAAVAQARPWQATSHIDAGQLPDILAIALQHLAQNQPAGLGGSIGRLATRLLGRSPKIFRKLINSSYQKELKAEGYGSTPAPPPAGPAPRSLSAKAVARLPVPVRQRTHHLLRQLADYLGQAAQTLDPRPPALPAARPKAVPREVRVVAVKKETVDATTLVLEDLAGAPFHFKPGQFFTLLLDVHGEQVMRSYSASNAPGTGQLTLTVKKVADGLGSTHLNERVQPGDTLKLFGPSGTFFVTPDPAVSREYVLLASGSGVTPMMSIAQTILATEPDSQLAVLYGNRRWEDVIFADAWMDLLRRYPQRLTVRHLLSDAHDGWTGGAGRLDEATARTELLLLAPSPQAHFYLCGPEPMMQGVAAALTGLGIAPDRIHAERFGSAPPPAAGEADTMRQAHKVTVQQAGADSEDLVVPAGKTILQAGLAAYAPLPFSCGMGNCGECRVKLLQGQVNMTEPNCLSALDKAQGLILTCVARPLTDVTLELPTDPLPTSQAPH